MLPLRQPTVLRAALLGCALLGTASPAFAQEAAVDGDYTSGPLREDYTVQNWQAQCGPVPKNSSTGGGGRASIRESGGVLSIASSERSYRSDRCYDSMPTLRAEPAQHDAASNTWRIRCTTPDTDPRKALMQTLVAVGKDRVDIVETGRYEIRLQSGSCVADVRRSQSFTRAALAVVDAGAPTQPDPPPTPTGCDAPGPPHRFEVNPTRKVAVAGSEFRLRIEAFDANGCSTAPAPLLDPGSVLIADTGPRKDALRALTVRVPENAPEGVQTLGLQQGKAEAKVRVEIVSRARYDELFATGELQGLEEAPDGGVEPIRFTTEATATSSDGETRRRKFIALIGSLLGILVLAGLVLVVRGRKRAPAPAAPPPAPPMPAYAPPTPSAPPLVGLVERPSASPDRTLPLRRSNLSDTSRQAPVVNREVRSCPVCHNEFEAPMQFCPQDGAQLGGASADSSGMVCPVCRRGFDASVHTCPDHGEELVPKTALGVAAVKRTRAKICPTCGERFEGEIAFCGKDGSALVVLN